MPWVVRVDLVVHLLDFGDRFWYFFIPSSLTSAIVDIKLTSNVDILGQWTFRVDLAEIVQPHSTLLQYA